LSTIVIAVGLIDFENDRRHGFDVNAVPWFFERLCIST
jgi:hypothetical protein